MKKLLLILSLVVTALASGQGEVPYNVLGTWQSMDGEILTITRELDSIVFVRKNKTTILATGNISLAKDGNLHITRYDIKDAYNLVYGIKGNTLVITQPRSVRAWLWSRVGTW